MAIAKKIITLTYPLTFSLTQTLHTLNSANSLILHGPSLSSLSDPKTPALMSSSCHCLFISIHFASSIKSLFVEFLSAMRISAYFLILILTICCWFYFLSSLFLLTQVSDDSSDSPEPGPVTCMEPFMVRRLSCRTVQLPPLAFRQAEQYYCDRKPESDTVTVPPRPTTLPLRTPPLIAITSADTSR